MKILVIPSWYPPNGGRFFRYQAEALAKLGHQVDVLILDELGITKSINTKIDHSKSKIVNEIRYKFYRIPKLNSLNTVLFIRKYKKILVDYLSKNNVDVIHIHSVLWAGVVVSEIALDNNIPYVITEHRSLFFKNEFPFSKKHKEKVQLAFNNASKIISVSNLMKSKLEEYTSTEICVIPNMVDTTFFKPKMIENTNDVFTFLSVGNLIEVKGFDILIKAFLLFTNENIELKIVGNGPDEESLKSIVNSKNDSNNLKGKVYFCGYKTIEELLIEYNSSSAYVSSSINETFGATLIEAMSCGLPIVATKSGGPNDIVNSEIGYLAEVNDVKDLYNKMKLMYDNYQTFDKDLIRKEAVVKYSFSTVIEQVENELKIAANKK